MNSRKFLGVMFLIIAGISLVFAISCFRLETDEMRGDIEWNESYGGDAYTGIQNAAAQTANNTYYVGLNISNFAKCVTTMGGFLFTVISFLFASLGVAKLIDKTCDIERNTRGNVRKPMNDQETSKGDRPATQKTAEKSEKEQIGLSNSAQEALERARKAREALERARKEEESRRKAEKN